MVQKKFTNGKNVINIILVISIVALGIMFAYINLVQYRYGINADVAAEGLLAKVIWESKEWTPKEWYFSTETRIVSPADVGALFYGLTNSMCLSMGLGCIVGGIFILWGVWQLSKELEFDLTQRLLLVFLVLLLPNSKNQIELMYLFAGYYAFHVGLYFVTLAYYLKLLKREKLKIVQIVFLWIFHFLLGAQGVRILLIVTGPLLAVELIRRAYRLYLKWEWRKDDNLVTAFAVSVNMFAFLGGRLPTSVGYSLSRNIRKAPEKIFGIVIPDFFKMFEWNSLSFVEKAAFTVSFFIVLYLIAIIVWKGIKKQNITGDEWVISNFFVSTLLTIAALTFTTVDSSSRYFIAFFFAIATGIAYLWKKNSFAVKSVIVLIIVFIFAGNCQRVYYPMVCDKSYKNSEFALVGEYLIQEGYEYAYSGFEQANCITVMTDGKIQVSAIDSFEDMRICKWLTSKKWYVPNVPKESKTAYVVTEYRLEEFAPFLEEHAKDLEFKTKIGIFNIYGSDYNYSYVTD